MRRAKAAARRADALLAAPAIAAGAAEPAHVLSYTTGRLTWDSATGIDENGAAVLSLFADAYQNVLSENGERVVAPGTDGSCTVRLENRMGYAISYIAVAYRIKEAETLPVEPEFSCEGAEDTGSYPLPEGVEDAQVIRAVRGELSGGQSADFRLDWLWEYYESDARDGPGDTDDTDGGYIRPEVPKTGDESAAWLYLALILLVAALLMSLPLVSACAKYVRELYAGSFTLTIQPQGNSQSQDTDQTPVQGVDQAPSRTINKSPSRTLPPFLIQNPARERLGRRKQDETRGAGIGGAHVPGAHVLWPLAAAGPRDRARSCPREL